MEDDSLSFCLFLMCLQPQRQRETSLSLQFHYFIKKEIFWSFPSKTENLMDEGIFKVWGVFFLLVYKRAFPGYFQVLNLQMLFESL